jgi:hypothetical protein
MTCLRVDIVGFADESFPGFVQCAFADANGNRHTFIEKVPVVTAQELWSDSTYPQPGMVPCEREESLQGGAGRGLARVSIGVVDSMDSPRYSVQFIVLESQLLNDR